MYFKFCLLKFCWTKAIIKFSHFCNLHTEEINKEITVVDSFINWAGVRTLSCSRSRVEKLAALNTMPLCCRVRNMI